MIISFCQTPYLEDIKRFIPTFSILLGILGFSMKYNVALSFGLSYVMSFSEFRGSRFTFTFPPYFMFLSKSLSYFGIRRTSFHTPTIIGTQILVQMLTVRWDRGSRRQNLH